MAYLDGFYILFTMLTMLAAAYAWSTSPYSNTASTRGISSVFVLFWFVRVVMQGKCSRHDYFSQDLAGIMRSLLLTLLLPLPPFPVQATYFIHGTEW